MQTLPSPETWDGEKGHISPAEGPRNRPISLKGARRGGKLQCPLEGAPHLFMPAEAQTQEGPAGGEADWGPWHQHRHVTESRAPQEGPREWPWPRESKG